MGNMFHISDDGKPRRCTAAEGKCPKKHGSLKELTAKIEEDNQQKVLLPANRKGAQHLYEAKKTELQRVFDTNKENASDPKFDDARTQILVAKRAAQKQAVAAQNISEVVGSVAEPDGGFTYHPKTGLVTEGFCFSPYPERCVAVEAKNIRPQTVVDFLNKNKDLLSEENHYVGAWNDPETGIVYLDVSVVTDNARHAREQCLEQDQIAFFDMQMMHSVTVNKNAKSGLA